MMSWANHIFFFVGKYEPRDKEEVSTLCLGIYDGQVQVNKQREWSGRQEKRSTGTEGDKGGHRQREETERQDFSDFQRSRDIERHTSNERDKKLVPIGF